MFHRNSMVHSKTAPTSAMALGCQGMGRLVQTTRDKLEERLRFARRIESGSSPRLDPVVDDLPPLLVR